MSLKLRAFPAATVSLLMLLASCAGPADEVLPVAPNIKRASFVRGTEVIVSQTALASVAATDRGSGDATSFAKMLARTIEEVTRAYGLTSGRALKLIVEVDSLSAPNAGRALLGADDRLAGSVFIQDAETGEALGQLYVDIDRGNGGLMSLLIRGGGIPEQLAQAFARRVATALGGDHDRTSSAR
jgi:hypothetical protein